MTVQTEDPLFEKESILPGNPDYVEGPIEKFLVDRSIFKSSPGSKKRSVDEESSLEPESFEAALVVGESATEKKTAIVYLPEIADIMFYFDESGSMYDEIGAVKSKAAFIFMTLQGEIENLYDGVSAGIEDLTIRSDLSESTQAFVDGIGEVQVDQYGSDENYGGSFF